MIAPPLKGEGDRGAQRRGGGGSPHTIRPEVSIARKQRREMSYPEVLLWQRLRGSPSGIKFRPPHPIGPYVADFCCLTSRLVIKVDGEIHAQPGAIVGDAIRDRFLAENGYRVLRVRAAKILASPDDAASSIVAFAARPLHHQPAAGGPPPRFGEDQE